MSSKVPAPVLTNWPEPLTVLSKLLLLPVAVSTVAIPVTSNVRLSATVSVKAKVASLIETFVPVPNLSLASMAKVPPVIWVSPV